MLRLDMGGKVHYTKNLSKIEVVIHIFRYMKMILIPKNGPTNLCFKQNGPFSEYYSSILWIGEAYVLYGAEMVKFWAVFGYCNDRILFGCNRSGSESGLNFNLSI